MFSLLVEMLCRPINIDNYCVRILNCQTTTGYVVKKSFYDTLISNMKKE